MNWELVWVALAAIIPALSLLAGLFTFIRKQDMGLISSKHDALNTDVREQMSKLHNEVKLKLYEAEFRRYEDRSDKQFNQIIDSNEALKDKIEEKFERIFLLLTRRRTDHDD